MQEISLPLLSKCQMRLDLYTLSCVSVQWNFSGLKFSPPFCQPSAHPCSVLVWSGYGLQLMAAAELRQKASWDCHAVLLYCRTRLEISAGNLKARVQIKLCTKKREAIFK